MSPEPSAVRWAVLRDYPLRLWSLQQEHNADMLREFQLLVHGSRTGSTVHSAPARLLELATALTADHGPALDRIQAERQQALDRGQDRMDSRVPLVPGARELVQHVRRVLADVDDYCRAGELLTLARPPEVVALGDWTTKELLAQDGGAVPTPWPGPF